MPCHERAKPCHAVPRARGCRYHREWWQERVTLAHEPQHDDQGSDGPSARAGRRHDDDPSAPAADREAGRGNALDRADPPGVGADRELDPVGDEVVDAQVVEAVKREVARELRAGVRSWRGPIPPGSELQAIDFVCLVVPIASCG